MTDSDSSVNRAMVPSLAANTWYVGCKVTSMAALSGQGSGVPGVIVRHIDVNCELLFQHNSYRCRGTAGSCLRGLALLLGMTD